MILLLAIGQSVPRSLAPGLGRVGLGCFQPLLPLLRIGVRVEQGSLGGACLGDSLNHGGKLIGKFLIRVVRNSIRVEPHEVLLEDRQLGGAVVAVAEPLTPVSYTHLTLPTKRIV
eukprot:TRINITY_DN8330_c0_g1_i2.p1 TRINITY_DN8330_c0_g1~~TRINITY_DN8330_c0_g1_i2.p1  ORF type:complete len:115 (+),score=15.77 TRINITY_DN8330_c0_g1_i2:259-603(+)